MGGEVELERVLVDPARDGSDGESEPRDILSQELGSASVKSRNGGGNADSSTHLVDGEVPRKLADHEEEEGQIEEDEDDNHDEADPQGRQARRGGRVNPYQIPYAAKNGPCSFSDTYRKMRVMMNQVAMKIPMAPVSCPGWSA